LLNQIAAIHGTGVAAATNSYESIATATLSSDGTVSFTSIPSTFSHLQIRYRANNVSASNYRIAIRFNSDTGSNYNWHYLQGNGSSAQAGANDEYTAARMVEAYNGSTNWSVGVIDILDYTNTNKYTTLRSLGGWDANGSGTVGLSSGLWKNTAAVTRIDIVPYLGDYKSGSTFALYGIKG
jgi:hypothetical protein